MLEMEVIQTPTSTKKHVREPPSVPFLWEIRPGIPNKDWKPEAFSTSSSSSSSVSLVPNVPPVKLIASVPFLWEQKPGIPLPSYSQEIVLYNYHKPSNDVDIDGDESIDFLWDEEEPIGSETEGSYCSVPYLMANCLVSSLAISAAVPARNASSSIVEDVESESESLSSENEGSTTSSYATGNSSLVGSTFLECLFPLFPPNSGFLGKVGTGIGGSDLTQKPPPESSWNRKFDLESNGSVVAARRPPTLGELIMMSRRRSCRRKAAQMRKYDISMELAKSGALGCCGLGNGGKMIEAIHSKRKQLPRLKLVWHEQKLRLESFFATGITGK